jgi:hypothetical protein
VVQSLNPFPVRCYREKGGNSITIMGDFAFQQGNELLLLEPWVLEAYTVA